MSTSEPARDGYRSRLVERLQAEVDLVDELLAGGPAAEPLRRLLAATLPPQYGLGDGMVVDRGGAISPPCELVVYDRSHDAAVLPLVSLKLFPVEIVRAVVAVEERLEPESVGRALGKLSAVARLVTSSPPAKILTSDEKQWMHIRRAPAPPLRLLFARESDSDDVEGFLGWIARPPEPLAPAPDCAACLDQGLLARPAPDEPPELWLLPVAEGGLPVPASSLPSLRRGTSYAARTLAGRPFAADSPALALALLLALAEAVTFAGRALPVEDAVRHLGFAHLRATVA